MPREDIELARTDEESDVEAETAEIRAEIQATRERMSDNLEQLGERLNPENIKDRVKQDVRDATIGRVENMAQNAADKIDEAKETLGEARRTMMDVVRENPIPAAMVGIGLGWLAYNTRQQRSLSDAWARQRMGRMGSGRYAGGYEQTGYGAGRVGEEEGTRDRMGDRAHELSGTAQEKAGELADRAQGMAGNVADETRYQARRLEDQFYENPLAIGAAALTLGVAVGLAIPETRGEQELMGGARDRLAERARNVAEETKDKVENVVERVADQAQSTAKSAARDEGLTAS
ncbi:MAG TPA: DUF3618 domain-containing protein [Gemmatimonadaceae bacterium]|nr:DUF3618 domain-containing protein [Gemmatimonadaceae bacterium]